MDNLNGKETRKSSKEALKIVYYVIIGLSFQEVLIRTFLENNVFRGFGLLSPENLSSLILLIAFMLTIIRFVHGASIHLDMQARNRFKPLIDFVEFFIQASLFYLMAISIRNPPAFIFFFICMLISDGFWILLLISLKFIDFDFTSIEWLIHNAILILSFAFLYLIDNTLATQLTLGGILVLSILGFITDYTLNNKFYFPE